MQANGYHPVSVTVAGGATRAPLWLQIHADVSNTPFVLTRWVLPTYPSTYLVSAAVRIPWDAVQGAPGMFRRHTYSSHSHR